jgi:hypothetical protein
MAGEAAIEVPDDTIIDVEVDAGEGTEGATGAGEGAKGAGEGGAVVSPAASAATTDALADAQAKIEEERRRRAAAEATAAAERQRADQATRMAQQSEQEAAAAREAIASGEMTAVTTGLANAQKALASAKAELKAAHESGDVDKMVDAQEAIGNATAELRDFNNRKTALESGKRTGVGTTEPRPFTTLSPLEHYIQASNFAPVAQNWLRAHPECAPPIAGGNEKKNNAMMAAHYDAVDKGITPNTSEYFEHLEKRIASGEASAAADPRSKAAASVPAAPARRAAPSAPPTNEPLAAAGTPVRSMRSVRLSPQQQETALFSYPAKPGEDDDAHRRRAFKVYAQEFLKAQAEGKIGRLTH